VADLYAIPPDIPFADGEEGAPRVWTYGRANPWRFAIDPVGRFLYTADVGHSEGKEIDVIAVGDAPDDSG